MLRADWEGETILSDLWFGMLEKRLARAEGVPGDDASKTGVRREFPPPARIGFRMWTKENGKEKAPRATSKD